MLQTGMKFLPLVIPRQVSGISVQGNCRLTRETHIQHPGEGSLWMVTAGLKAFGKLTQYLTLLTAGPSHSCPQAGLKHPGLNREGPTRSKANELTWHPGHTSCKCTDQEIILCSGFLCPKCPASAASFYAPCKHSPALCCPS